VNYKNVSTASRHTRNVEEKDVVLSESHDGYIAARIWSLFNIHPLERSAAGSFH
jgi:hypothetical protein